MSQLFRSRERSFLQKRNMPIKFVTVPVFILLRPVISVKEPKFKNRYLSHAGRAFANEASTTTFTAVFPAESGVR